MTSVDDLEFFWLQRGYTGREKKMKKTILRKYMSQNIQEVLGLENRYQTPIIVPPVLVETFSGQSTNFGILV